MTTVRTKQSEVRPARTGITGQLVRLRHPELLVWWEWGKVVGAVVLVVLGVLFILGRAPRPAIVGVLLHITSDFTFQSPGMALRKWERGPHLLIHAIVGGGFPLVVAGFMQGGLVVALTWATIGAVCHYAIDWSRRFGIQRLALGVALDQASHVLSILIVIGISWPG